LRYAGDDCLFFVLSRRRGFVGIITRTFGARQKNGAKTGEPIGSSIHD
jgi:hypothetical protein